MRTRASAASRRGVVLLAVLLVVVILSLTAYQYSEWMSAEYQAADNSVRSAQARALADSGVHYVAALMASPDALANLNGNPFDNAGAFQGVSVPGDPNSSRQGYFSVVALLSPDDPNFGSQPYRFGLIDEAGKINLNALIALENANGGPQGPAAPATAAAFASSGTSGMSLTTTTAAASGSVAYQLLMGLPNMTDDVANAILDWLDPDDTARATGAEGDYYSTLSPPYRVKNGPLDSLEELLLVKGVTPQLLFGNDRNRNGVLDPDEDDGSGQATLGWAAYLTVYSLEPNVDSTGAPRIYVNTSDLAMLQTQLTTALGSADLVNFILAYRLYGPAAAGKSGPGSDPDGMRGGNSPPALAAGDRTAVTSQIQTSRTSGTPPKLTDVKSLYDLVNGKVGVTTGTGRTQKSVTLPSPLGDPTLQAQLLPLLLDKVTTSQRTDLTPRVNVNTASPTVLQALAAFTGLQATDVQNIVAAQPLGSGNPSDPIYTTPAWLLTKANLTVANLRKLEPYITARSQVYRFQSVGYIGGGAQSARVEAVVDANGGRPRVVYWRNLSELGRGFNFGTNNP